MKRTTKQKSRRLELEIADPQGMVDRIIRTRTGSTKKEPGPRRIALRIHLDEEDFKLLEKDSDRNRTWQAEVLLSNAIRASWAYDFGRICTEDRKAVEEARDFFSELYRLQEAAQEAINLACITAKKAAGEAAKRCQHWLDAEKARLADVAAGGKAIAGNGPAPDRAN